METVIKYINSNAQQSLLTEQQAAQFLNWSVKTLQARRHYCKPPRWVKVGGRSVRYRLSDLEEFVTSSVVEPMA